MEQTLLLNATFEPIKVLPWQRAVTLWCKGKVEIVEVHDREIHAVRFTFKMPSVVRLLRYVKVRRQEHVPFTRANIYARDNHECQYCGGSFDTEELTFDHVIPATAGGIKSWENITTACVDCNRRKGGRTPEEAGMTLLRAPRRPSSLMVLTVTIGRKRAPANWRDYLYWNAELETGP
jgi:5-methylcytosine-specific restriction endonuclease McrA